MANFELAKGKRRSLVKVGVRGSRNEPNKPSKVSGSIKGLVVKRRELKKKKKETDSDGGCFHTPTRRPSRRDLRAFHRVI